MGAAAGGASSYYTFCSYLLLASALGGLGYVGGFAAYNYKYKDLRGMELLPHRGFWAEQPGQMRDGALWSWFASTPPQSPAPSRNPSVHGGQAYPVQHSK